MQKINRFTANRERWAVVRVLETDTRYRVSSEGRIRRKGAKELSPYDNGEGYFKVTLYVRQGLPDGTVETLKVQVYLHRLVALAHVERPSDECWQVHHLTRDKSDNYAVALMWVSPKMHAKLHGRPPPPSLPLEWKQERERVRSARAPF